uniref:Glycoprotein hormone subunit beta domain-containing protein n=1 Tax=Accipiter nisus TaxID=211598 RepID=A0A8B9RUD2_9AVES
MGGPGGHTGAEGPPHSETAQVDWGGGGVDFGAKPGRFGCWGGGIGVPGGYWGEPVYRSPLGAPSQAACTYFGVRYERWVLGGCAPGTDPGVTVPVALGCRCGRCPMATADCTVAGLGPAFCGAPGGFGGQ